MIRIELCEYNSIHKQPFARRFQKGYPYYLLLLIKTNAFFEINGSIINTPPNTVALFTPHTYLHYGSELPYYVNDWLYFEMTGTDVDLLNGLNFPLNTPFQLPNMSSLIEICRLIITEHFIDHLHQQETITALMHSLFYSIASQYKMTLLPKNNEKYFYEMNNLRIAIKNSPNSKWNIPEMAASLHLSTSHFQYLYKHFFGISCMQDVISLRLEYVKHHLSTTNMSIHDLALYCGYDNEYHLIRQFKKYTGLTPREYRVLNQNKKSG